MDGYFTKYPTHIEVSADCWTSTHDVEYEVVEG